MLQFEHHLETNLIELQEELSCGKYRHGSYQPFTICDPKQRLIHKATVRDRVVHQALFNCIEPSFERRFIFDSYSCRMNKGVHAAVDRLRGFLRQASRNDTRTIYALKCDVSKFFASVDHVILTNLLQERIHDERLIGVAREIIDSFSMKLGKGIPLGNLTSQLFANVYLHELDRYVKFVLREEWYIRYCDDFVILDTSRQKLLGFIGVLRDFLKDVLQLDLHPTKVTIRTWNQEIDFLGHILFPKYTLLRAKTVKRMLRNMNEDNFTSYLGLCSHVDAYELGNILKHLCIPDKT